MVEQLGLAMTPLCQGHVLGVHLGNHQRHVLVHAEGAELSIMTAPAATTASRICFDMSGNRTEQRDVDAFERLGRHLLHDERTCGERRRNRQEGKLLPALRADANARTSAAGISTSCSTGETQRPTPRSPRHSNHRDGGHIIFPGHRILLRVLMHPIDKPCSRPFAHRTAASITRRTKSADGRWAGERAGEDRVALAVIFFLVRAKRLGRTASRSKRGNRAQPNPKAASLSKNYHDSIQRVISRSSGGARLTLRTYIR